MLARDGEQLAVAVLLFDVEVMMRAEGAPCDRAAQIVNPLLVNFGLQASELWTLVLTIDVWLMMKAPLSSSSPSRWRSTTRSSGAAPRCTS